MEKKNTVLLTVIAIATLLVAVVGATIDLGLVWSISDTCNGLMVIPNLIGVFLLSGTVFKLVKEYFNGEKDTEKK